MAFRAVVLSCQHAPDDLGHLPASLPLGYDLFIMWDRVSKTLLVVALAAPLCVWAQKSADEPKRSVLEQVKPVYPELARRNGLTGIVKLKVIIAPDGKAKAVEVVGGNPVFLDVATTSVKKWKWSTSDHESTQIVEIRFQPS